MDQRWIIPILVGLAALALIIFLAWKNQRDKKRFEEEMNKDYRKSKDEEGENDVADTSS